MKYSVNQIIKEKKDWKKDDFIFFWKIHTGKEVNKSYLSQWYPSEFIIKGRRYNSAEQYMMAQKALLFEDEEIYKKIILSSDPKEIKSLGRKVRGFEPAKWDEEKYRIVREGNFAKFTQKQELRDYLVSTEGKILVEASPYDNVWGIGMTESNLDILDPSKWNGQNLLGFILMDIRDEIIERIQEPRYVEREEDCTDLPIESRTDEITGEVYTTCIRRIHNDKFLPEPQEIWKQMIIEEYEIFYKKKEKEEIEKNKNIQISDKLKQFLISEYKKKTFLSDEQINEKINWYSTLECSSLFEEMEECSDGCFEIDKEYDGWYAFVSEPGNGIEIGPYDTYKEALECATIAAIKRIYMKKDLNFSQELYKPEELE